MKHGQICIVYSHERLWVESDDKVQGCAESKENIDHVKRKAEDYYWEADNLQEEKQVGEFTLCVDEDDDDTDDEEGSATDGTMSDDSSDDEL